MAASMEVEACFISSGCNRIPHSVHWGLDGLICFGTGSLIAIYKLETGNVAGHIQNLLHGHTAKVHCVKWIEDLLQSNRGQQNKEFVSGAADNNVIIWSGSETNFQPSAILKGHTSVVTAVDAKYLPSNKDNDAKKPRTCIISASCDSTVKVWERKENHTEFTLLQNISFGNGFALDVALGICQGILEPILAIGGDDTRIHLYTLQDEQFTKVQSLHGHEDWIRGLEFACDDVGDLLLASCSQDCFIRLWRISQEKVEEHSDDLKLKGNVFSIQNKDKEVKFTVTLESLLAGHEHWIYAVHWQPPILKDDIMHQPMCLLSASMDKTMIIWRLDTETGVWQDQVCVGEVGGNTLGLYGCQMSPDGSSILGHGYQGAFHLWSKITEVNEETQVAEKWQPSVTVSGHFGGVQDLDWDPSGEFLLSVSTDQTTRLFAPWKRKEHQTTWHEIARPQVHGYDMQCLAMTERFQFVSGADEKVLRVFDAPLNFLQNLSNISACSIDNEILEQKQKASPEGASVPALGLSNKAVFAGDSTVSSDREIIHPSDQYTDIFFSSISLTAPPTEEHLLQNTLWPETQKLYGHGYEVFCVASHPSGKVIASACKASKPEHANIILWDTSTWRQVCKLASHSLTVTQIAFSHSGRNLLSVSRDRTWALFEEETKHGDIYKRIAHTDKKSSVHSRIIWSCCWSHDDRFFATASRDKKVIIWGQRAEGTPVSAPCLGNYAACSTALDIASAATAVDFAPIGISHGSYILAVGSEAGKVTVHSWTSGTASEWNILCKVVQNHSLTVRRLRWRPIQSKVGQDKQNELSAEVAPLYLASCSSDGSLVLHHLKISMGK